MANLTVNELRYLNTCPELYAIKRIGMKSRTSEKRLIIRKCINALSAALSDETDYVSAVVNAVESIPKDFFIHSCEEDAMKMKLEAELLRVGGYLLEYIGGDSCKSSVKYDFSYGENYRDCQIDKVTGMADLVIERKEYIEAIYIRSGLPAESYIARSDANKPINSITINAIYNGIRTMYPGRGIKVSLFYLTSKKDDKKKDFFADYELSKGSNIISVDYSPQDSGNLSYALQVNRTCKCSECDQRTTCRLKTVRIEEELPSIERTEESKSYEYTDSQKKVIDHVNGAMYIEAVPGAGKTAVLTERCCALVNKGIKPDNILCVTFTNKAKDELKARLTKKGCVDVSIETFNSLGYNILRECSSMVGDVRLAEDVDKKPLIEKALSDCYNEGIRVRGANYSALQGGEYCLVNMFYKKIENIETYGIDAYLENRAGKDDTENTLKVYEYYKQLLKVDNYIYYDEQISKAIELFENKPNILKMYQNRFKYIMVDEFQDVNEAQFKMVKMLAGSKENVVCVGDSDQSIYSWRGGDPSFALNFKDYFPSAEIVFMVDNFRCTKSIADVANTLISNNTDRYNKNIAAHKDGMPVWFYDLKNNPSDIGIIIGSLLKKFKPGEIAIISRKNNSLDKFGLCIDPTGNLTSKEFLIEDAVFLSIRDLLTFMSDQLNYEALYRLLVRCGAGKNDFSKIKLKNCSLMDCLNNNTSLTYDTDLGRAYEKILKALEYLKNSDDFYEDGVMESTLSRIINILFDFDFHPVIKILTDKAYERIIRTKSELLFYMNSLVNYGDSTEVSYKETDEKFNLLTAHSSKGKEFPCVVIYGVDAFESTPEERRLLYVSMTRAKESLFIIKNMDSENMVEEFKTCCHEAFLRRRR